MSFSDLFRVIDDPFFGGARPTFYAPARALREAPFVQNSTSNSRSGVDLTEEGNNYIVEAELPGVKRENLNVTVGDGGRSVTIEGKVFQRNRGTIEGTQNAAIEGAPGSAQNTPATEGRFSVAFLMFMSDTDQPPLYRRESDTERPDSKSV